MIADSGTHAIRRRRGRGAAVLLILTLTILAVSFFRVQVLGSSGYMLRSEENRVRAIPLPAPRGTIYDRHGRVLAENLPGYVISLLPSRADTVAATLDRLAPYLDLRPVEREGLMERFRRLPNQPLVVRDNATFEQVSLIEERRPEFRRAVVEMRPRRHYPPGPAVAHLMGYVGEISEPELERPHFVDYEPGRIIGKDGVERQYEHLLGGRPGVRFVEVNALGSIVREFGPRPEVPAVPGQDIQLGIDLELQLLADSIFPADHRGAVVALDVRTGEVLVLYSHPTFDPNRFIGGIDLSLWRSLRNDPERPLLNRVTTATYAPGSTWKLVVAAIGMARGDLSLSSRFPQACLGALTYGNRRFRCWRPAGHGSLDLRGAIKHSCNVYFYQAGLRLGLDALTEEAARFGFNTPTGIDLPHEARGLYPSSREWYDRRYGPRGWTESVVLNLSIGQGENQQTLLRKAQFYAGLATGQPPVVPHLLRSELLEERRAQWTVGLPDEERGQLVDALAAVVNEPGGTAFLFRLDRWTLAGKTGSAQNPHGAPHSWFVGFAPAEEPRIVVAAIVEAGYREGASSPSAPIVARIVERFLESEEAPLPARLVETDQPAAPSLGGG